MNTTTTNILKYASTLAAGGLAAGALAITQQCGVSVKQLLAVGATAFAGAVFHLLMDPPKKIGS